MDKDLKDYLKNAKNDFKEVIAKYNYNDHKELNTAFDSFLLAYEQAESKAINYTHSSTLLNDLDKMNFIKWRENEGYYYLSNGFYEDTEKNLVSEKDIKKRYKEYISI